jgi:hypothetical protein
VHTFGQMSAGYLRDCTFVGETAPEAIMTPAQFKPFTIDSLELETLAQRRFSLEEIVRMYSVHLDEIGGAE